ncbi:MAG TPA: DUF4142 domain-containing protein [Actinomycetota bacterium]|nr:DUF4142 domain-containing protein [Actinomycetota bacterium]
MRTRILAGTTGAVLALSLIAAPAVAGDRHRGGDESKSTSPLSRRDISFLRSASQGNIFEITGGTMAATQSVTPESRALGLKLASDHTAAQVSLAALAARYGVSLPATMSDEQSSELAGVASTTGARFDDEYSELEVQDHTQDIKDFKTEIKKGRNADVRTFAAASLPLLQTHLALSAAVNDVVEALPAHVGDTSD